MAELSAATRRDQPATSEAPCMFWKLPPEIRDMIYGYVYCDVRAITVVTRTEWEGREEHDWRMDPANYVERSFPEPEYSCMLVSKQYMDEAVVVYLQRNTFHFVAGFTIDNWLQSGSVHGELVRYMSKLRVDIMFDTSTIRTMPCLKTLDVTLNEGQLELDGKLPWFHDYTDLDIVRVPCIAELLELRGLRKLTLRRQHMSGFRVSAQEEKLSQLVQQIERLLSDVTTMPKGIGGSAAPLRTVSEMLKSTSRTNRPALNRVSKSLQQPTPCSKPRSTIAEMPKDKGDFVRLFFSDPDGVFDWIQSAASRLDARSRLD